MIIISSALVLSGSDDLQPNNPVIGWDNKVTISNIQSLTEQEGFPITNVANPITSPLGGWKGASITGDEEILITLDGLEDIDYVGIARHNLGSNQIPILVEGSTDGGSPFEELVGETYLLDDAPAIFRFVPQSLTDLRITLGLTTSQVAPEIAVIYVGKLLIVQRRLYVGHTPINFGRSENVVSGKTENGDFLGRIILSEQRSTEVALQNLTPSWYRSEMDPFIQASKDTPFFFAWRPFSYPYEVGFGWMTNNPQPVNQRPNGMMQIQLQMTGIAP